MARKSLLLARGATMIEYALVIVAVMLLAASMFKTLGKQVRMNGDQSVEELVKRGQ